MIFMSTSPCRSQLLYFIMTAFLVFNWFRLFVGVTFDWSCDRNVTEVITADLDPTEDTVLFNNAQVIYLLCHKPSGPAL